MGPWHGWHPLWALSGKAVIGQKEVRKEDLIWTSDRVVAYSGKVVSILFENDITVNFTMSGFTPQAGMGMRQTRIMGTHGYLEGDMNRFKLTTFNGNKEENFATNELGGDAGSGHGGGDLGIIRNFVEAVRQNKPSLLSSTLDVYIESHIMAFKGEQSRKTGVIVKL